MELITLLYLLLFAVGQATYESNVNYAQVSVINANGSWYIDNRTVAKSQAEVSEQCAIIGATPVTMTTADDVQLFEKYFSWNGVNGALSLATSSVYRTMYIFAAGSFVVNGSILLDSGEALKPMYTIPTLMGLNPATVLTSTQFYIHAYTQLSQLRSSTYDIHLVISPISFPPVCMRPKQRLLAPCDLSVTIWFEFGDWCYHISPNGILFQNATSYCAALNASLLKFKNESEVSRLMNKVLLVDISRSGRSVLVFDLVRQYNSKILWYNTTDIYAIDAASIAFPSSYGYYCGAFFVYNTTTSYSIGSTWFSCDARYTASATYVNFIGCQSIIRYGVCNQTTLTATFNGMCIALTRISQSVSIDANAKLCDSLGFKLWKPTSRAEIFSVAGQIMPKLYALLLMENLWNIEFWKCQI